MSEPSANGKLVTLSLSIYHHDCPVALKNTSFSLYHYLRPICYAIVGR